MIGTEKLLLKWGSLKGWGLKGSETRAALKRYAEEPTSVSAMTQHDTPAQKQAICDIIAALDGPIFNDWSGEEMTKDEAREYVLRYGEDRR